MLFSTRAWVLVFDVFYMFFGGYDVLVTQLNFGTLAKHPVVGAVDVVVVVSGCAGLVAASSGDAVDVDLTLPPNPGRFGILVE